MMTELCFSYIFRNEIDDGQTPGIFLYILGGFNQF